MSAPEQVAETHTVKKIAGSAIQLLIRRALVTVLSAVTTAVMARYFGVADFGSYSAAFATYFLLLGFGDFGFSYVLARSLGAGRPDDGAVVRATVQVQTAWLFFLTAVALVIAALSGFGTTRGQVLLILLPAMAAQGFGAVRQLYYANYRTGRLGVIDVATNAVQSLAIIAAVTLGAGPLIAAALMMSMMLLNAVLVYSSARKLMDDGRPGAPLRKIVVTQSLPLGLSSALTSAYFMVDLVILGFLVSEVEVGYYAAAAKVLTILVTVPGILMTAALPGISAQRTDRASVTEMVSRLYLYLGAVALPICLCCIVFAPALVRVLFGAGFEPAVPLVRLLAVSAVIALWSSVFGAVMVAHHRARWLFWQNLVALVVNLGGNLLLVGTFGAVAAAWLTVVTEAIVCVGSVIALRSALAWSGFGRAVVPSAAAGAALVTAGLLVPGGVAVALPVSVLAFLVVLILLRGWPAELPNPFRKFAVRKASQ